MKLVMPEGLVDLSSLCAVVVVVVCSWGLSLLLSRTCWNAYQKYRPSHIYCTQCSSLKYHAPPPQYPVPQPQYHAPPPLYLPGHYLVPAHTAERLGILETGEQPVMLATVLQSSNGSYTAYTRRGGAGLEPIHLLGREEEDDRNISRRFRSGVKKRKSRSNSGLTSAAGSRSSSSLQDPCLTLNERFGALNQVITNRKSNVSRMGNTSARNKLSQVIIPCSPSTNENHNCEANTSRTPVNDPRSTRKSDISKRSVSSILGSRRGQIKKSFQGQSSVGSAKSTVNVQSQYGVVETGVLTSEINLDTSDEDVFTSCQPRAEDTVYYKATPVDEDVPRQLSQEVLLVHKPHLIIKSQGSSGGSDWTNPRKDRQVGSPGNTATAEYYIKQQTPQLVEINLDKSAGEKCKTYYVDKSDQQQSRRVSNSASTSRERAKETNEVGSNVLQPQSLTARTSRRSSTDRTYRPGYVESDFTSQSEDETKRQKWDRRGGLNLTPNGPSPGSHYDYNLLSPQLDLSQEGTDTGSTSANKTMLQNSYSPASLTQSDISLVVSQSPAHLPSTLNPLPYPSSESSHPASMEWDNYASSPVFQKSASRKSLI